MKPDIARHASRIISSYMDNNVPPTDTLTKIAKAEKLNKEWVGRIAEAVNVKLYQDIHEKVGSSMIEFSLADPKVAMRRIRDEERATRRHKMTLVNSSDTISELEKGASIAAADEVIYHIQKKIEKASGGMQKVASGAENLLRAEESQAIKKYVDMVKGAVSGYTERTEREINNDVKEIGDIIMSDTRATGNTAEVLSQVKTAAIEAFPEYKEGMSGVMEMVKESSPHLSSLRAFSGEFEKVSIDKDSRMYELLDEVSAKMHEVGKLYKVAEELEEANVDFYPKTKEEGRAIIEKVSALGAFGNWFTKAFMKSPTINAISAGIGGLGLMNADFSVHNKDEFAPGAGAAGV